MSEVGFTVSVRRIHGGVPVAARFPACSPACVATVRSRVERAERPPVPVEGLAWLFADSDSPGSWFHAVRGATFAPPRPPRVVVGPAEVDAECSACGAAVPATPPPVVGSAVVAVADDANEEDAVDAEW